MKILILCLLIGSIAAKAPCNDMTDCPNHSPYCINGRCSEVDTNEVYNQKGEPCDCSWDICGKCAPGLECVDTGSELYRLCQVPKNQQCPGLLDCRGCSFKGECIEYNPKMAKPDPKGKPGVTRKQFFEYCIKHGGIDCSDPNQDILHPSFGSRACEEHEHTCPGKLCIPGYAMCDGRPDCEDHSDENNCADKQQWKTRWQYNDTMNCEDQYPSCSGWEKAGYCNNTKILKKYPYAEKLLKRLSGEIETDNFLEMNCAKTCDACKGCTDSLPDVMPNNPLDCPPIDCAALIRIRYGRGCDTDLKAAFHWFKKTGEVYPNIGGKLSVDRRKMMECERSLAPAAEDDGRAAGITFGEVKMLKGRIRNAKIHQFCNLSCNKCGKRNNMPNGGQCFASDECSSGSCTRCPDVKDRNIMKCGKQFGTPCTSDDQCCGGQHAVCGAHTGLCERVNESYKTVKKDDLCRSQGFYEILSPDECRYAIRSFGFWDNDHSRDNWTGGYKTPKDYQACFFGTPHGIRICKADNQYGMNCGSGMMHDITISGSVITSPNYPNEYNNNDDCKITIRFAFNQVVSLRIEQFDVERNDSTCNKDYLAVHEGDSISAPMIGYQGIFKLCGNIGKLGMQSTGNVVTLHFHSDHYNRYIHDFWATTNYRFKIWAYAAPKILPIDEFAWVWKQTNGGLDAIKAGLVLPNVVMESTSNSTLKLWQEGQPEIQDDSLTWDGDKTFTWGMMGAAQGTYDGISTIKWHGKSIDGLEFTRIGPGGHGCFLQRCTGCLLNGQCKEYNRQMGLFRPDTPGTRYNHEPSGKLGISKMQFIQECIRIGGIDCSEVTDRS